MRKEFLADIASVTASQAVFGKATHPALTREEWARAERTGFAVVPTVELREKEERAIARERGEMVALEPGDISKAIGIDGKGELLDLGISKKKKRDEEIMGIGKF